MSGKDFGLLGNTASPDSPGLPMPRRESELTVRELENILRELSRVYNGAPIDHAELGKGKVNAMVCDALLQRVNEGWRPIETAPKNERVLIFVLGEHRIGFLKSGGGWNQWQLIPGKYGIPNRHTPTHWMPLPEPPKMAQAGRDE